MASQMEFHEGRLVEQVIDHGDGTGTRTTYHPDGSVDTVEQLSGLPYDPPTIPDDALLTVTDIRDASHLRSPR